MLTILIILHNLINNSLCVTVMETIVFVVLLTYGDIRLSTKDVPMIEYIYSNF